MSRNLRSLRDPPPRRGRKARNFPQFPNIDPALRPQMAGWQLKFCGHNFCGHLDFSAEFGLFLGDLKCTPRRLLRWTSDISKGDICKGETTALRHHLPVQRQIVRTCHVPEQKCKICTRGCPERLPDVCAKHVRKHQNVCRHCPEFVRHNSRKILGGSFCTNFAHFSVKT